MLAIKSKNKKLSNNVFLLSKQAKLSQKNNKETINGTLGVLYDDNENFLYLECVKNELNFLSSSELFSYAENIDGDHLFKKSIIKYLFEKEDFKNLFYEVVASPGGSGALSNTFSNYLNKNEVVLLPNLMWGSYKIMIDKYNGKYECYRLFNDENKFDISSFEKLVYQYASIQKNLIVVLNTPCHNPTGYKLSDSEISKILAILKKASTISNIILINDIAYFDFDTEKPNLYKFIEDLPENLLVVFAFSLSKSLSLYGNRVGAQVAFSSSEKNITDFYNASLFTSRALWSNINSSGMKIFSNILSDDVKYKTLREEQNKIKALLKNRADIFIEEASKIELDIFPYKSGFFISIPFKNKEKEKIEKYLIEKNIFLLVFDNYIRVALCSIPTKKIYGLAKIIKNSIELKGE